MPPTPTEILKFDEPIKVDGAGLYRARVVGVETPLHQWEGWLEFTPEGASAPTISTERETTQPNRTDLGYWATGLSTVYIQGALRRAVEAARPIEVTYEPPPAPSIGPAGRRPEPRPPKLSPVPVLDPFAVYVQGEDVLRQELGALSGDHLRNIVEAYGFDVGTAATSAELVDAIILAVRNRI